MLAGVVELAVAAGVQVGVALGTGVSIAHTAARGVLNRFAAFPATELHKSGEK
jgi:hypothetical protein